MGSSFFTTEISDASFERDRLRHITVRTENLHGRGDITVYVPDTKGENTPVVILLHGVYGSAWCWPLKAGVHLLAEKMILEKSIQPMVLVMPSDGLYKDGSAYLPHLDGNNYEKWIVEDVLNVVQQQIKIVSAKSPVFITGLSMGGYGALRLGAKYPQLFTAFRGLSSITEFKEMSNWYQNGNIDSISANVSNTPSVLQIILENKNYLKPFIFDCGDKDILIASNRHLHLQLVANNIEHTYNEYPGEHTWDYWATHVKRHLLFFNNYL